MDFIRNNWEIPLFIVFAGLSITFADVDLWLSAQFWHEQDGFYLNDQAWVQFVYVVFRYMPVPVILLLLLALAAPWFIKSFAGTRKYSTFLLLVLLIGPGLIVHPFLKDNWDRPRPRDVQEFNGDLQFKPAFIMSEQEGKNQSFASGHGAMGFYFIAFAWVFRKRRYLVLGILIGSIVSAGRIVQGGHFLTDVLTAGFIVYFTCRVLSYYLLGHASIRNNKKISKSVL